MEIKIRTDFKLELSYYTPEQVCDVIQSYFKGVLKKTPEQIRYFVTSKALEGEHYEQAGTRGTMRISQNGVKYILLSLIPEYNRNIKIK